MVSQKSPPEQSLCSQAAWYNERIWLEPDQPNATSNKEHDLSEFGFPTHKMVGIIFHCLDM